MKAFTLLTPLLLPISAHLSPKTPQNSNLRPLLGPKGGYEVVQNGINDFLLLNASPQQWLDCGCGGDHEEDEPAVELPVKLNEQGIFEFPVVEDGKIEPPMSDMEISGEEVGATGHAEDGEGHRLRRRLQSMAAGPFKPLSELHITQRRDAFRSRFLENVTDYDTDPQSVISKFQRRYVENALEYAGPSFRRYLSAVLPSFAVKLHGLGLGYDSEDDDESESESPDLDSEELREQNTLIAALLGQDVASIVTSSKYEYAKGFAYLEDDDGISESQSDDSDTLKEGESNEESPSDSGTDLEFGFGEDDGSDEGEGIARPFGVTRRYAKERSKRYAQNSELANAATNTANDDIARRRLSPQAQTQTPFYNHHQFDSTTHSESPSTLRNPNLDRVLSNLNSAMAQLPHTLQQQGFTGQQAWPFGPSNVNGGTGEAPSNVNGGAPTVTSMTVEDLPNLYNRGLWDIQTDYDSSQYNRIVYTADLHGDFKVAFETFYNAGLIDESGNWRNPYETDNRTARELTSARELYNFEGDENDFLSTRQSRRQSSAENTMDPYTSERVLFIQGGDVVDRGPDSPAIYELLWNMKMQAPRFGSSVVLLYGNHEIMNMIADHRYLSKVEVNRYITDISQSDEMVRARVRELWGGEGYLGNMVRNMSQLIVQVDDMLFMHGGIIDKSVNIATSELRRIVEMSQRLNVEAKNPINRRFINRLGVVVGDLKPNEELKVRQPNSLDAASGKTWSSFLTTVDMINMIGDLYPQLFYKLETSGISFYQISTPLLDDPEMSIIWSRRLTKSCPDVQRVLNAYNAVNENKLSTIVVAHTPTESFDIESRCGGALQMTDTAASRWMGGVPVWMEAIGYGKKWRRYRSGDRRNLVSSPLKIGSRDMKTGRGFGNIKSMLMGSGSGSGGSKSRGSHGDL